MVKLPKLHWSICLRAQEFRRAGHPCSAVSVTAFTHLTRAAGLTFLLLMGLPGASAHSQGHLNESLPTLSHILCQLFVPRSPQHKPLYSKTGNLHSRSRGTAGCHPSTRLHRGKKKIRREGLFLPSSPLYRKQNKLCYATKGRAASAPSNCCFPLTAYGLV